MAALYFPICFLNFESA